MEDDEPFHHRSGIQKPKKHKTKGRSKPSALNKAQGRVANSFGRESSEKGGRKRQFQHANQWRDIGKAQRHATAVLRRKAHREELLKKKLRYFGSIRGGIPKVVALVPLSAHCRLNKITDKMLRHCDIDTTSMQQNEPNSNAFGLINCTAMIGNRPQNFAIWQCNRNQWSILDIAKVADIILLVTAPSKELHSDNSSVENNTAHILGLDSQSTEFCSLLRSQGISNIIGLYQPRYTDASNERDTKKAAKYQCKVSSHVAHHFNKYVSTEFGSGNRVTKNFKIVQSYDMQQLFRFMADSTQHSEIEWREKRSYLVAEQMEYKKNSRRSKTGTLKVTGFLRGKRPLDAKLPVHITGVGDFHISRIEGIVMERPDKVPILPSVRAAERKQQRRAESASRKGDSAKPPEFHFLEDEEDDNDKILPDTEDTDMMDTPKPVEANVPESSGTAPGGDDIKMDAEDGTDTSDNLVLAVPDTDTQVQLNALRPMDELATAQDQSIITEEELAEADRLRRQQAKRIRMEKRGYTDHRDAWEDALGWGSEDADSDKDENVNMDMNKLTVDDLVEETAALRLNESELNESIQELAKKKELEREETQYPDEVETPINMAARVKFAQYRGLKQFSRTKWDKFEELPIEYSQIYHIRDWKAARKQSKIDQKLLDLGALDGVVTGRKICIHIRDVPYSASKLWEKPGDTPLLVWGLLEHEHRYSVCHYVMRKEASYDSPAQGLESYIFDCAFRRIKARPIFSENSKTDKHLVTKFLKSNAFTVVSVYAPIMYPPTPILMFEDFQSSLVKARHTKLGTKTHRNKRAHRHNKKQRSSNNVDDDSSDAEMDSEEELKTKDNDELDIYDLDCNETKKMFATDASNADRYKLNVLIGNRALLSYPSDLVATGTLLEVNAHRLLIKRKVLTGYPMKIHKRRAVIRYMFWNDTDVNYFKPLDLWTKGGLHGKIEEPISDKGYMKCFFDDLLTHKDIVCLSLYKRIFPIADPSVFQTVTVATHPSIDVDTHTKQ